MIAVPPLTPVTIPVPEPTVATEGAPLLHTPPACASARVEVTPWQNAAVPPVIAGGGAHQRSKVPFAGGLQAALKLVLLKVEVPAGNVWKSEVVLPIPMVAVVGTEPE